MDDLSPIRAAVAARVAAYDASHDMSHIERVYNMAVRIAKEEGASPATTLLVRLSAYLHDIDDYKYTGGDDEAAYPVVKRMLADAGYDANMQANVCTVIRGISFHGELPSAAATPTVASPAEAAAAATAPAAAAATATATATGEDVPDVTRATAIVQDADRLDAIGAIGIARCLTYGGAKGRVLHDPSILPAAAATMTKEAYMAREKGAAQPQSGGKAAAGGTTINHFHEKLLLLAGKMKTDAGRRLAAGRHAVLQAFLEHFYAEWEGQR